MGVSSGGKLASLLEKLKPISIYFAGVSTPIILNRTVNYLKKHYEEYADRRDKRKADAIAEAIIKKYRKHVQDWQDPVPN